MSAVVRCWPGRSPRSTRHRTSSGSCVTTGAAGVAALSAAPWLPAKVHAVVAGGDRRQVSVAAGVAALPGTADDRVLLIHDGARPLVSSRLIEDVIRATVAHGAAIPVDAGQRDPQAPGWRPSRGDGRSVGPRGRPDTAGRAGGPAAGRLSTLPAVRPRDMDRRGLRPRGLYHPGPCRRRRSRESQGDPAGGPGPGPIGRGRPRPRPDRDRARLTPLRAGSRARAGRDRHRRPPRDSTATRTAMSPCTRSATRSLERPARATSVGCSRPARRHPPGSRARRCSPRSVAGSRPRAGPSRAWTSRSSRRDPGSVLTSTRCGARSPVTST